MLQILGCLFAIFFSVIIALFVIARNLLSSFLGKKGNTQNRSQQNSAHTQSERQNQQQTQKAKNNTDKKPVFDESEGEYVDFVEVN